MLQVTTGNLNVGGSTLTQITFKSQLSHQSIFWAKLRSHLRVGYAELQR